MDITALAIDTHWSSARGGISTINRLLCTALAKVGVDVYCFVPGFTVEEKSDASKAKVKLVAARATPGASEREALMRRPQLPAGVNVDLIIGHGRITGPAAMGLAHDHYPLAARLHVVHTAPDETEWCKPDLLNDAAQRAEERLEMELQLARDAAGVIAIGPRLYDLYLRELSVISNAPRLTRLDPGFDAIDLSVRRPPLGRPRQILLFGRLEDYRIKGIDIASRAISYAADLLDLGGADIEFLLRGAPAGQQAELRNKVHNWMGRPFGRVTMRSYSTDTERLRRDLQRATVVLLPSRAEGFGLVGLEAIAEGAPVLVSNKSGLGMLLCELLSQEEARRIVIPVQDDEDRDTKLWGHAIGAVLRDPGAAFSNATKLRQYLTSRRTWEMAATMLIEDHSSFIGRRGGRSGHTSIPSQFEGVSECVAADARPKFECENSDIQSGAGGSVTRPRRFAVVARHVSPVHRQPDETSEVLKYKYMDDVIEIFSGQPARPGWQAVRTPRDNPGYAWMRSRDLTERA